MLEAIYGTSPYKSPTDMGVNMISQCIINDEVAQNAAKMEIIRRYYSAVCDFKKGIGTEQAVETIKKLMNNVGITTADREIIKYAIEKAETTNANALAIQLNDGKIITGKDCLLGIACMFVSFAIMQNRVLAINGISYKDMLNIIKARK